MIAALYIEPEGCYADVSGVDAWCEIRDARSYVGPHPVVAHPPCQRWGRMAKGGPSAPDTEKVGHDNNCFASALDTLATYGGVIEHPEASKAWRWFGLEKPTRHAGWQRTRGPLIWWVQPVTGRLYWRDCRREGEWWTCYVEQGHYGHMSRKPTWLLTNRIPRDKLPELNWSKGEQRLHPTALARYGYEKARRIGMTAMVGGKDKTKIRNATPVEFRDLLISIAQLVGQT